MAQKHIPFSNIIGQKKAISKIQFFSESQNTGSPSPHILLGAGRGLGKTAIIREYARSLTFKDSAGQPAIRPYIEVNCATIKNCRYFFEGFITPNQITDKYVTVGFDEAHKLPDDVQNMMLTILNNEKSSIRTFKFNDIDYVFDFNKISFIFATTDTQKLAKPLVDRMEVIDLKTYTTEELRQIIQLNAPKIQFQGDSLVSASTTVRFNARNAVHRAGHITKYCQQKKDPTFGNDEWFELCERIGIYPLGLQEREVAVLRALSEHRLDGCTLTHLAAKTGNSKGVVQNDIEHMLLALNLMKIEGRRFITKRGIDILDEIDK